MNANEILEYFKNLSSGQREHLELKAALNGTSIEGDVIPILVGVACVSPEAAKLFIDSYSYLN